MFVAINLIILLKLKLHQEVIVLSDKIKNYHTMNPKSSAN